MVNIDFAYCIKEGTIATTAGKEIEQVIFLGQESTIMRAWTSKDGDLLSYFDNIKDTDVTTSTNNISLNHSKIGYLIVIVLKLIVEKLKVIYHLNIYLVFVKISKSLLKILVFI